MANLLSLKRRIKAALNVSKTTRAMQMIATSKLKRAQDATLSGRPYVEKLSSISQNLLNIIEENKSYKYLQNQDSDKTLLIILSPDKGLCGGLIVNITRELINFDISNKNCVYLTIGKKIEQVAAMLKKEIVASFKFGTILPQFETVYPIMNIINDLYLNNKVGVVKILFTNFSSVFSQKPKITQILPIEFPIQTSTQSTFTLIEPNLDSILPDLLKHYLEMTIYQHLLESFASEQAARMIAMQNATENATEVVEELKLEYNKGRQERITNEILDITGTSFATL